MFTLNPKLTLSIISANFMTLNVNSLNYPINSPKDLAGIQALAKATLSGPYPPVDASNRIQTLQEIEDTLSSLNAERLQEIAKLALDLITQDSPLFQSLQETFWSPHKVVDVTKTAQAIRKVFILLQKVPDLKANDAAQAPDRQKALQLVASASKASHQELASLLVRTALTIDPELALAYRLQAALLRNEGKLCKALQAIETALRLDPSDHAARALQAEIELKQLEHLHDIPSLIKRAKLWFEWDELTKALEDLNRVIDHNSASIEAILLRGTIYLTQAGRSTNFAFKRLRKAERDFLRAIDLDPENHRARCGMEKIREIRNGRPSH